MRYRAGAKILVWLLSIWAFPTRAADIDPFLQRQALLLGNNYAMMLCGSLKTGAGTDPKIRNDLHILAMTAQRRAALLDTRVDDLSPLSSTGSADAFKAGLTTSRRLANRLESRRGASVAAGFRLGLMLYLDICLRPQNDQERRGAVEQLIPEMKLLSFAVGSETQVRSMLESARGDDWRTRLVSVSDAADSLLAERFAKTATGARLRVALWNIANSLSLAAVTKARGNDEMSTNAFEHANDIAAAPPAGIPTAPGFPPPLPALPRRSGIQTTDLASAMGYIMREVGESVTTGLRDYYGGSFASLFELGSKLSIASLVYQPDPRDGMTNTLVDMVRSAGAEAKLPPPLYGAIANPMARRAPPAQVTHAIVGGIDTIYSHLQQEAQKAGDQK